MVEVDEGPSKELPGVTRLAPHIRTTPGRKQRSVTVVGDSLLRRTEGSVCQPDPSHREACCLPGARSDRVLHLGWNKSHYQYRLREEVIESSSKEKDLRMLVDGKLEMSR